MRTRIGLLMVGLCGLGLGQVPSDYALQQRYGASYFYHVPTEKLGDAWTLHSWLRRAGPFAPARAGLEERFAKSGFDAEAELTRLGQEAKVRPADALAQFRWATLGFLTARRDGDRGVAYWSTPEKVRMRAQIQWALALAPDPADAEYDRMRFIYEAAASKADLFRELGKRLVLRWPNDDALRRNQAENLATSNRTDDVDKAIAIADALMKKNPSALRYIGFMGDIYRSAWIRLHRREDGLADIEWTERFLKLAPPSANGEALRRAAASVKRQLGLGAKGD